jgi:hypothetical protein
MKGDAHWKGSKGVISPTRRHRGQGRFFHDNLLESRGSKAENKEERVKAQCNTGASD